jgi:hypothetical protein
MADWFASLFPEDWEVPEFLVGIDGMINDVLDNTSGIGAWVDLPYILVVVGAVVLLWTIAFLIKVARALIAHLPLIGGKG